MLVSRPSFAPSSAVAQFPAQNSHTTDRSRPAKHCRQRLVRLLFTGVLCLYLFAAAVPSQSICREWREKGLVLLNGAGNRSRAGLAAICGHASGSCNPNSNRRAKAAAQPQADDGRTHVGGRPLTRGHVASHPHKKCRRGMPADQAKRDCQQKLIILGGIRQMQIPSQSPIPSLLPIIRPNRMPIFCLCLSHNNGGRGSSLSIRHPVGPVRPPPVQSHQPDHHRQFPGPTAQITLKHSQMPHAMHSASNHALSIFLRLLANF